MYGFMYSCVFAIAFGLSGEGGPKQLKFSKNFPSTYVREQLVR